jgi:hypothetical protein
MRRKGVAMRLRRLAIGVVATGMSLTTISTVGGASMAWAKTAKGSGTVQCATASVHVTFSPPLTNTTTKETVSLSFSASSCTGGAPTPDAVTGAKTFKATNGEAPCRAIGTVKLKLSYNPMVKKSTWRTFFNLYVGSQPTGQEGGTVSGSYSTNVGQGGPWVNTAVVGNCASGVSSLTDSLESDSSVTL